MLLNLKIFFQLELKMTLKFLFYVVLKGDIVAIVLERG